MNRKILRLLVSVAIVALVGSSWYSLISNSQKDSQTYNLYLNAARNKAELGLIEDAKDYYLALLEFKDSLELREEIADFYLQNASASTYEDFCILMQEDYPLEAAGYERLAVFYRNSGAYSTCFSVIRQAVKRGVSSDKLTEIETELAYQYTLNATSLVDVRNYSSGFCAVQREDGYWGYVNGKGTLIIQFLYKSASAFLSSGYASVQTEDGQYVIINTSGRKKSVDAEKKIIEDCTSPSAGKMSVQYEGKYHYCDLNYNQLFGSYDYAGTFQCGAAAVMNDGKWSVINEDGEVTGSAIYEEIVVDEEGIAFWGDHAFAKIDGKYILIDVHGKQIGSDSWDEVDAFRSSQPAAVKKDGKWGYIDTTGALVVSYRFENARSFANNMAAVQEDGKWGYISIDDYQMKIEPQFTEARYFSANGCAFVKNEEKWCILKVYRLSS